TVADELKMARSRPGAESPRVIGISLKDRAAILPGGPGADAASWLDMTSGDFITSTYYRPALPAWMAAFNQRKIADSYAGKTWTLTEGKPTEPHTMPEKIGGPLYTAVFGSPFGNELLLALATEKLAQEKLPETGRGQLLTTI